MNKGDFVEIEYVGKVKESGEIFDLTDEKLAKEKKVYNPNYKYGPIVVVIGANQVLPGLDEQLQKENVGSNTTFDIPAEKAFGERKAELTKTFQLSDFRKQKINPIVGQYLTFQSGAKGKIVSVSSGRVKVDFNHPLSGKAVEYQLKVLRKIDAADEQARALLTFYLGSKVKTEAKIDGKKLTITSVDGPEMPQGVKKLLAGEITKYVKAVEEVDFVEAFKKQ